MVDTIKRWIMPGWIFTHIASGEKRDPVMAARRFWRILYLRVWYSAPSTEAKSCIFSVSCLPRPGSWVRFIGAVAARLSCEALARRTMPKKRTASQWQPAGIELLDVSPLYGDAKICELASIIGSLRGEKLRRFGIALRNALGRLNASLHYEGRPSSPEKQAAIEAVARPLSELRVALSKLDRTPASSSSLPLNAIPGIRTRAAP